MNLRNEDITMCSKYEQTPIWIFGIKVIIAGIITAENVIVLMAILRNWKSLTRQQNLYRYVLSLVAADLFNGIILLIHALFWIILLSISDPDFHEENLQEVLQNLITGVLHGLTFASLASAALLNVVLRVTSTRALARAAAIKPQTESCYNGTSWARSPRITVIIIGFVWIITLAFLIIPLIHHCHVDIKLCLNLTGKEPVLYAESRHNQPVNLTDAYDCSLLRTPAKRSYLLALNVFISCAWGLMIICNISATCIKTKVEKSSSEMYAGGNGLTLRHTFGIARDSSSFFALIITLNMSLSTIPYVIFTFITEAGSPMERLHFSNNININVVEFVEISTYFSSALNPIIYTAMLGRLRGDVAMLLHIPRQISIYRGMRKKSAKLRISGDLCNSNITPT